MPSPDNNFTAIASYIRSEGDSVFIRLTGIRIAEASIGWNAVNWLEMQPAFERAFAFAQVQDVAADMLSLLQSLVNLPRVIPRGYSLPCAGFIESTLADVQWFTFPADYFFHCITSKPYAHVDTGIDGLVRLYAQLLIDCVLEYRRTPRTSIPDTPYDCERFPLEGVYSPGLSGWVADLPLPSLYRDVGLPAFSRIENRTGVSSWVYSDCFFLWNGQEFSAEQMGTSFLFANTPAKGLRTDPSGRIYYFGCDWLPTRNSFPLKSIENIPYGGRHLTVTYGYESVSGVLNLKGVGEEVSPIRIYPPPGSLSGEPCTVPPFFPLVEVVIPPIKKRPHPKRTQVKVDDNGSFVGYGGYKL